MILAIQIIALVCFLIAWMGFPLPAAKPLGWGWFGLFLWLISLMLGGIVLHPAMH